MTKKTRDRIFLLSSGERLTKEFLEEKLTQLTCAYGRGRAREEYVKIRKFSQNEIKRGIWHNDDLIFLEQEIEEECAGLCTKWASQLEGTLDKVIEDHLSDENDEKEQ